MHVQYLAPLCLGLNHPTLRDYDLSRFSSDCYAVSIGEGAGVDGPLMEGDVLIVDEARVPSHGDLVLAEVESEQQLFHYWRPGYRTLLRPVNGSRSHHAQADCLKGVVVSLFRQYAH